MSKTDNPQDTNAETSLKFDLSMIIAEKVSSHLCPWLIKHKNIEITVEELVTALGLPFAALSNKSAPVKTATSVPAYFKETGKTKSKPGTKTKTKSKPKPSGDTITKCSYTFTRGQHVGDQCGKPVAGGNQKGADKFCKNCLTKKAVMETLENGESEKDLVKPPSIKSATPVVNNNDDQMVEIKVENYRDDRPGFMFFGEYGFVIKYAASNEPVVLGTDPTRSGTWKPLSKDEEQKAIDMGLYVASNDDDDFEGKIEGIPQL